MIRLRQQFIAGLMVAGVLTGGAVMTFHWSAAVPQLTATVADPSRALTPAEQAIDFSGLEQALRRIAEQGSKPLTEYEGLDSIIRLATDAYADEGTDPLVLGRLQTLVRKSLPTETGRQFAELLPGLLRYRRAEARLAVPPTPDAALALERATERYALQQSMLGHELAAAAYGDQYLLESYLIKRRLIKESGSLEQAEKSRQLQALRERLEQNADERPPSD